MTELTAAQQEYRAMNGLEIADGCVETFSAIHHLAVVLDECGIAMPDYRELANALEDATVALLGPAAAELAARYGYEWDGPPDDFEVEGSCACPACGHIWRPLPDQYDCPKCGNP